MTKYLYFFLPTDYKKEPINKYITPKEKKLVYILFGDWVIIGQRKYISSKFSMEISFKVNFMEHIFTKNNMMY